MSNYDFVTLCRLAGKTFPDAVFDAVLKDHSSCGGVVVIGAADEYLGSFLQNEGTTTKDVQDFLSQHPDKNCILSFGKCPKNASDDNVQPFVGLFNEEGDTTLSVCLSGTSLSSKSKDTDTHSAVWDVYNKLILPQILKAAKAFEDDAEETWTDMASDPAMAALMKMVAGDDGNITIISNKGQITWGQETHDIGEAGWTTNLCGYVEKAEPKSTATSKKSNLGGFGKKPDGLPAETKTATSQVSLPPTANEKKAPDPGNLEGIDWMWWSPPSGWTKDQKRKAYIEADRFDPSQKGIAPPGYKDCPKIKVRIKKIEPSKNVTPKEVTSSNPDAVTSAVLHVISPKSKEYVKNVFFKKGHVQKTISEGKVIIDPKRIAELEEEYSTFVESSGLEDIRQTLFYTDEDRMDLIKNAPDAAMVAWGDVCYAYYKLLEELNRLDLKVTAVEEQTEKHTLAKEILKPVASTVAAAKKFGGFGKK